MRLIYLPHSYTFVCVCRFEEKDIPKQAGFRWNPQDRRWETKDRKVATKLQEHADNGAKDALEGRQREEAGCCIDDLCSFATNALSCLPPPKQIDFHRDGQTFVLRPYQEQAVKAAASFLRFGKDGNGIIVLPTGAGKSVVIANIPKQLDGPVVIFQPSKEILEQNYGKLRAYGYDASIYSASMNEKRISDLTFATIGSVKSNVELFRHFKYILVDECHLVSAKGGMYHDFIKAMDGARALGLTATPYRLASNSFGSELRFLTRTRPRIFKHLIYYVQNRDLFDAGYLAPLAYVRVKGFSRDNLLPNSTGADYSDDSVKRYYKSINFPGNIVRVVRELLKIRRNVLVFTRFIDESEYLMRHIDGAAMVTGETPKREREQILQGFKAGEIPVVSNVGVLTHGFDYPELETVLLARPTMSLTLYYQMIGRAIRPYPDKRALIVDLCDNIDLFGEIEDLKIEDLGNGKWVVSNKGKQLTNTYYGKENENAENSI